MWCSSALQSDKRVPDISLYHHWQPLRGHIMVRVESSRELQPPRPITVSATNIHSSCIFVQREEDKISIFGDLFSYHIFKIFPTIRSEPGLIGLIGLISLAPTPIFRKLQPQLLLTASSSLSRLYPNLKSFSLQLQFYRALNLIPSNCNRDLNSPKRKDQPQVFTAPNLQLHPNSSQPSI